MDRIIEYKIPKNISRKLTKKYRQLHKRLDVVGIHWTEQVRLIYEYMDQFNELVHTNAVCSKGCTSCCYIAVGLSPVEAMYIAEKENVRINKVDTDLYPLPPTPCPFLDENEKVCTIYKSRPIGCRNYFTFDDPKFCWPPDQEHLVSGAQNAFGNEAIARLAHGIHQMSTPLFEWDIRKWFPYG